MSRMDTDLADDLAQVSAAQLGQTREQEIIKRSRGFPRLRQLKRTQVEPRGSTLGSRVLVAGRPKAACRIGACGVPALTSARARAPLQRLRAAWVIASMMFCGGDLLAVMRYPPEVTYPVLAARAASVKGFVPQGWVLEREVQGDLNGDGRPDRLFVLHQRDRRNILPNTGGLGVRSLDTNPRLLAVAYADEAGGFRLVLQDHRLIPRHVDAIITDAFSGVAIQRGSVKVSLEFFASAGTYDTVTRDFLFRSENDCWRLIGFEDRYRHRGTGHTLDRSVNYLTGRMKVTSGSGEQHRGAPPSGTWWEALQRPERLCLASLGNGLEFEPGKGRRVSK